MAALKVSLNNKQLQQYIEKHVQFAGCDTVKASDRGKGADLIPLE